MKTWLVIPLKGRFHVAYTLPGIDAATSVLDCPTEAIARYRMSEYEVSEIPYVLPENRPIPRGFYNLQMDLC